MLSNPERVLNSNINKKKILRVLIYNSSSLVVLIVEISQVNNDTIRNNEHLRNSHTETKLESKLCATALCNRKSLHLLPLLRASDKHSLKANF